MNPPAFIADEVVGAPLDFKWNGPGEHVGPMETVTPLLERIGHKTSCGVWSLGAGVLLWGGWRLKGHAPEADAVIEVAEAMFMHQVDLRYLDRDAGPRVDRPESPSRPRGRQGVALLHLVCTQRPSLEQVLSTCDGCLSSYPFSTSHSSCGA